MDVGSTRINPKLVSGMACIMGFTVTALPQAVFSGCLNQPKSISLIPMYCQYIQITRPQGQICKEHQPSRGQSSSPMWANRNDLSSSRDLAFKNPPFSQKSLPLFSVVPTFAICPICPGSPICGHKWKLSPSMKNLHRLWLKRSTLPVPGVSSNVAGNSTRLVRWFCPYESFNVRPPR